MLTVCGNSIHFWHANGFSCESVKVFETENISTWGGLEPPIFGFMANALAYWTIRTRHLLSHVFEYWLWWFRYFWSKVNIWNVNCARATAFIFETRTSVLVKVSNFSRQNMSRPEEDSNPQPQISLITFHKKWYLIPASKTDPWALFTKRMSSYGYMNPHYKPRTVWRPYEVYKGDPYTNKTVSFKRIEARASSMIKTLIVATSSNATIDDKNPPWHPG